MKVILAIVIHVTVAWSVCVCHLSHLCTLPNLLDPTGRKDLEVRTPVYSDATYCQITLAVVILSSYSLIFCFGYMCKLSYLQATEFSLHA